MWTIGIFHFNWVRKGIEMVWMVNKKEKHMDADGTVDGGSNAVAEASVELLSVATVKSWGDKNENVVGKMGHLPNQSSSTKKVYINNLHRHKNGKNLQNYFSSFGNIAKSCSLCANPIFTSGITVSRPFCHSNFIDVIMYDWSCTHLSLLQIPHFFYDTCSNDWVSFFWGYVCHCENKEPYLFWMCI